MARRVASRSVTGRDDGYNRKTAKPYIYLAEWGTRGSKASKQCTSLALAKHPLAVWAQEIKRLLARTGHTVEERTACLEMIRAIDSLGEFKTGAVEFDIEVASDGMWFAATITRIA